MPRNIKIPLNVNNGTIYVDDAKLLNASFIGAIYHSLLADNVDAQKVNKVCRQLAYLMLQFKKKPIEIQWNNDSDTESDVENDNTLDFIYVDKVQTLHKNQEYTLEFSPKPMSDKMYFDKVLEPFWKFLHYDFGNITGRELQIICFESEENNTICGGYEIQIPCHYKNDTNGDFCRVYSTYSDNFKTQSIINVLYDNRLNTYHPFAKSEMSLKDGEYDEYDLDGCIIPSYFDMSELDNENYFIKI